MSIFDKMKNKISNKTKQRSGTMSRPDSSEPFLERQEKKQPSIGCNNTASFAFDTTYLCDRRYNTGKTILPILV